MSKILAPFSSEVTHQYSGVRLNPEFVFSQNERHGMLGKARDDERGKARILRGDMREQFVSSVAHPFFRRDEYVVEGRMVHEVRVCVEEGARCSMTSMYSAHEKDTDISVRFFVTLKKDADFSLDIGTFLLRERAKSDVRIFLVLNKGCRATVRQLTHVEGFANVVHEEIRGLAVDAFAHASFIPELELMHADVVATHAASVVRLDEQSIAYLLARGFSRSDAVECLAQAFLQGV